MAKMSKLRQLEMAPAKQRKAISKEKNRDSADTKLVTNEDEVRAIICSDSVEESLALTMKGSSVWPVEEYILFCAFSC